MTAEPWIEELTRVKGGKELERYFRAHRELVEPGTVAKLHAEILRRMLANLNEAERLARAAEFVAAALNDKTSIGLGERALGHIEYARARYEKAVSHYGRAAATFASHGHRHELARTRSSGLQSLIYLGRYEMALAWAEEARAIFQDAGDELRLARLDGNLGNMYCRQDRFEEAIGLYRSSLDRFRRSGEPRDIAGALSNLAVCAISLHNFDMALSLYVEARTYCEENGMPVLVAEADYNIAYLHFLRGEYTVALDLYASARKYCETAGDSYHSALCDLDQAEVYLELNMVEEGAQLAARAHKAFLKLGMGYERAKALAFEAVAWHRAEDSQRALRLFQASREIFVQEGNPIWPALVDLYRALVLFESGSASQARRAALRARRFFVNTKLANRAAICELLLARLDLQAGDRSTARKRCLDLLQKMADAPYPVISFQAEFVLGQVEESAGRRLQALEAFERAQGWVETLRSRLFGEGLKIAFLKDKLAVYESLVRLSYSERLSSGDAERIFGWIEKAKSRALADMLSLDGRAVMPGGAHAEILGPLLDVRQRLNDAYRQIDLAWNEGGATIVPKIEQLWNRARDCERELLTRVSGLRLEPGREVLEQPSNPDAIREWLPADATLLEYYRAADTIYACVLTRDNLTIRPVAQAGEVGQILRLLRFQFAKFRLSGDYLRTFSKVLERAASDHLRELYDRLMRPVRHLLNGDHLVVVPHGHLHHLPFHALLNGERAMMDDFTISYAPSAGIFRQCATRHPPKGGGALVLGVPGVDAPNIETECRIVASLLPGSRLFLGRPVTLELIRELGKSARVLHLATHGIFRHDSPMFSSIRLGDSNLSLFDLSGLQLGSELVVLSGCSTGMNVVVGGDELVGLLRGFLNAGANSVLVSLWEVNDQATAEFMSFFYNNLRFENNIAGALRKAMEEIRREHSHPYYWAPFALTGKYLPAKA